VPGPFSFLKEVLLTMPDKSIDTQKRYFGLDIHKHYFVVEAVNRDLETVYSPERVSNEVLEDWAKRVLTTQDDVVLESGKEAVLPPPPPLRTGLETFASSGSSLCSAPCGTWFHNS
jgi:hypothetical protein